MSGMRRRREIPRYHPRKRTVCRRRISYSSVSPVESPVRKRTYHKSSELKSLREEIESKRQENRKRIDRPKYNWEGTREERRNDRKVHYGDGIGDPELRPLNDDPRVGHTIKRAKAGRNSDSFEPESTFVRPEMRIKFGPTMRMYNKPLKHDDVIVVPEFFCKEDDFSIYYKLINEMRQLQARGQRQSEWISWHEGCHLISKNPKGCPTYEMVLERTSEYFNIQRGTEGTRFNWYRDSSDWKPFHHDSAAFNPERAKNQNITVGISFGAERELAFLHAKNRSRIYMPQTNGMLFSFGRDVNIKWKHGINALPKSEWSGVGRISIVVWGNAQDVIEEEGSPGMLTNDARRGYDNRKSSNLCRDFANGCCRYGNRCRFSHGHVRSG